MKKTKDTQTGGFPVKESQAPICAKCGKKIHPNEPTTFDTRTFEQYHRECAKK